MSFIGSELAGERWKHWRIYSTDIHPTGEGTQRLPGMESADAAMAGYPKVFNIEMDPHENLNVAGLFGWVMDPALEGVLAYERSRSIPIRPRQTSRVRTWRLSACGAPGRPS